MSEAKSTSSKPRARVVSRTFYRDEPHSKGDMTICVHYTYDRQEKTLKYGSSVFRKETNMPSEQVNKRYLRHTAMSRHNKRPVVVANFEDSSTLEEFHDSIRALMFKHGVRGDRV